MKLVEDGLRSNHLVKSMNEGGAKWYELLNPAKEGGPVQWLSYIGGDTLTHDQIEKYYRHRFAALGLAFHETANGLQADCPFCKNKGKPLGVRLPKNGKLDGGVWNCVSCATGFKSPLFSDRQHGGEVSAGNIVMFEQAVGELKGKRWDGSQARRGIERVLQGPDVPVIKPDLGIDELPDEEIKANRELAGIGV